MIALLPIPTPRGRAQRTVAAWFRGGIGVALAGFLAGCASVRPTGDAIDERKAASQVRQRLHEIIEAAERKEFARLDGYHLYGGKFTKFSGQSWKRQDARAARHGEHVGLGAVTHLQMSARDLKIDVFGRVAVATFVLEFSFRASSGTNRQKERATLVFVHERGSWRIVHEHLSVPPAGS